MPCKSTDLDALIEDLTLDAYGEEEQLTGFLTGAEDALERSEQATIIGVSVQVISVTTGPACGGACSRYASARAPVRRCRLPISGSSPTVNWGSWQAPTGAGSAATNDRLSRAAKIRIARISSGDKCGFA